MSHLNEIWAGKLFCYLGLREDIRRVQQAKFILGADKKKNKQLQGIKEKMDSTIFWNFLLAIGVGLVNIRILQRVFPNTYGKIANMQHFLTDAMILTLWAGGSMMYSLRQLNPEIEVWRKKWILQHNLEYLKLMRSLSMNYEFTVKDQIEPYVPKKQRIGWKIQYDELLK